MALLGVSSSLATQLDEVVGAAVFLDRDGVINRTNVVDGKPYAPRLIQDFEILKGVPAALGSLVDMGFMIFVVTNQPDLANGLISWKTLNDMHAKLGCLPITEIKVCPHNKHYGCECRKPAPGMIMQLAAKYDIDLRKSYLVGDRVSDLKAGIAAGCKVIFIDYGYEETQGFDASFSCSNLHECVSFIATDRLT